MVVLSGPNRWYTFATIGLKSPLPTIAIDPARAEEKIYKQTFSVGKINLISFYPYLYLYLYFYFKSDWHLISPYHITPELNIKVRRIKEMITNIRSS